MLSESQGSKSSYGFQFGPPVSAAAGQAAPAFGIGGSLHEISSRGEQYVDAVAGRVAEEPSQRDPFGAKKYGLLF